MKNTLKVLSIPLTLLLIYLSMIVLWKFFHLPSPEELTRLSEAYFKEYGLWIVFLAALIEGFILIGEYFPGGFVIFIGVISARGSLVSVAEVLLVTGIAFFVAYYLNYLVGRYGFHNIFIKFGLKDALENAKIKLMKHTPSAILGSYWEPNLASIVATAAGVLKIPVGKFLFYSAIGIALWNIFWGTLVYFVGETLLKDQVPIFIGIITVWCILLLVKVHMAKVKN